MIFSLLIADFFILFLPFDNINIKIFPKNILYSTNSIVFYCNIGNNYQNVNNNNNEIQSKNHTI